MEPLDIYVNLNQNISDEAPKAAQASDEMTKSLDSMQKEIERLNKVVVDMSTALAEQRKIVEAGGDEMAEYAKKVEASQAALEKAEKELLVYQSTAEQMNKAVQEGADVTNVLNEAREGLAETEAVLIDNAEELVNNQNDINEALEYSKQKVETNTASNQILSASIKKVCDLLGIENTQVKNAIGNVRVITAAKQAWRNGVVLLNKELGITIAQAKVALGLSLAIGIGAIVAAVGLAVVVYRAYTKEKREANRLAEEEKKLNKEVASEYAIGAAKVKALTNEINNENISNELRKKRIEDLKKIIPGYNGMLDKEGNLINNNTVAIENYLIALKEEIRLKAQRERLEKLYAKQAEISEELYEKDKFIDANKDKAQPTAMYTPYGTVYANTDQSAEYFESIKRKRELKKEEEQVNSEILKVEEHYNTQLAANVKVQAEIVKDTLDAREKEIKELKERLQTELIGAKEYDALLKSITDKEKDLEKIKGNTPTKTPKTTPVEKASASLEKMSYDIQKKISDARVKAIHDGAEKERQAAKAEYEQTQAHIEKELKDIAELEKKTGKPATEERGLLFTLDVEASRQYEAELGRINAQSKATLDAIFAEVSARFASELDKSKAEINSYYAQQIKDATVAGASVDKLELLRSANSKDLELAEIGSQHKVLDIEQEVATQRLDISNKRYLFESDRIKKQLEQERDFTTKRLALAKKEYKENPNADTAQQVKKVNAEIEGLDDKLTQLPAKKMKEIAGYATMLVGSLQELSGEDMSALNSLINGMASLKTDDMMGAASSGLGFVTSMIGSIVNKSAQEEQIKKELLRLQNEYNIALRQQNFDLIESVNYIRLFKDNLEALHWLVEKGFITNVDNSAWEVFSKQSALAMENLEKLRIAQDSLVSGAEKYLREANFNSPLFRESKLIQEAWNEGKISIEDAMTALTKVDKFALGTDIGEYIRKNKEETQKWLDELKELAQQMDEFATGTSFDGFLDSTMTALDNLRKGVGDVADFTEEALTNAILSSFKYQVLSAALKPFYEQLADKFITDFDGLDKAWGEDWKSRLQAELGEKGKVLDGLFESMGIDGSDKSREGAKGLMPNVSQDSFSEALGVWYGIRQMVGDLRNDGRESLLIERTLMGQLDILVERSEHWEHLKELPQMRKTIDNIEAYGVKINP